MHKFMKKCIDEGSDVTWYLIVTIVPKGYSFFNSLI